MPPDRGITKAELLAAFPGRAAEREGSVYIDQPSREEWGRFKELTSGWRRKESDRSTERDARRPEREVVMRNGERRHIKQDREEKLGREGRILHVPFRAQGLRVERGPDGFLYRELAPGRWECIGRIALTTPWPWQEQRP